MVLLLRDLNVWQDSRSLSYVLTCSVERQKKNCTMYTLPKHHQCNSMQFKQLLNTTIIIWQSAPTSPDVIVMFTHKSQCFCPYKVSYTSVNKIYFLKRITSPSSEIQLKEPWHLNWICLIWYRNAKLQNWNILHKFSYFTRVHFVTI